MSCIEFKEYIFGIAIFKNNVDDFFTVKLFEFNDMVVESEKDTVLAKLFADCIKSLAEICPLLGCIEFRMRNACGVSSKLLQTFYGVLVIVFKLTYTDVCTGNGKIILFKLLFYLVNRKSEVTCKFNAVVSQLCCHTKRFTKSIFL